MAWYLSEIVTDLSPVGEILKLYDQTGSFSEGVIEDEYKKRLVPLLRQTTINTDHIETDNIPAAYENDEYKWLASGYHDLIRKLGLVEMNADHKSDRYSLKLTEAGRQVLNQQLTLSEVMKASLPEWKNDAGIRPYPILLDLLSNLKQRNLYPCGGLLLLEVLIVLLKLNQPHGHIINLYGLIQEYRKGFFPYMTGEVHSDLINYSGFLWEQLSQDLSNYHAANYPARATLQLMMYAGDLAYGPVPDEIFGLVQYVTIA
jgi:hypothetical protein